MKPYTLEQLRPLLQRVEKPGRYAGGERNLIQKNDPRLRFGISYPDLYEIGMSNNGIQILYHVLNSIDGVACERVFAPAKDFSAELISHNYKLYGLESFTPIDQFDLLGFNLSHELLFTNVLLILERGGITLRAKERGENEPIIVAGGEASSNPAPASLFADVIFLGEGEEGIAAIARAVLSSKKNGQSRKECLSQLSAIEGVLIPSLCKEYENSDGFLCLQGESVHTQQIELESRTFPEAPVVPNMRTSQERAVIELTRGCFNLCKFCHAGYYTLPYRSCPEERIAADALTILENTGYEGVTFSSLSISDYRRLVPLINRVLPELNRRGIGMNLPSLKVDSSTLPIIEAISKVKQVSLTFAVEAGHTQIRKIIHKRLSLEELMEIVDYVFSNGWKTIKLYFMLGLPGYREYDEADAIIELLKRVNDIGKGRKKINVTLSPFIPKPHTPFENVDMASLEYFDEIIVKIKSSVPRKVDIKNHNIYSSYVEGFLSRGDLRAAELLFQVYQRGCTFDSWSEHFEKEIWLEEIAKLNTNNRYYSERKDSSGPWSIVTTGREKLISAKKRKILTDEELSKKISFQNLPIDEEGIKRSLADFEKRYHVEKKIRIIFSKGEALQYVSHLDYVEVIKRAMRIVKLPLSFSRGFHKREKIGFGFPLPLGIESEAEIAECELYENEQADILDRLNSALPKGVSALRVLAHTKKESIMAESALAYYTIDCDQELAKHIASVIEENPLLRKKNKRGEREVAVKDAIYSHTACENGYQLVLLTGTENSLRIDQLTQRLLQGVTEELPSIVKTDVASLADNTICSLIV